MVLLGVLLMMVVAAPAQTRREREVLSIEGYPGEATVIQFQGHAYVDVQELARITNGSLRFERGRIILTLACCDASALAGEKPGFSRSFRSAAIEAMASIREWGGMLMITVQNGYPVGNNMAGNTITAFQGRAADSVAIAAAAASTDSDYRGLELLRNEFNNVKAWSDRFVQARSSLSAANLTITENALQNDEDAQKVLRCGQFLAQMFASGTFQDDASCH
ncbi:MAG: hypothetical protein LAN37_10855 [Acidobacteriia bacterium]|nr:hypothetical protein [Terriglobia bacterium]